MSFDFIRLPNYSYESRESNGDMRCGNVPF